jgi:hypothetical protein
MGGKARNHTVTVPGHKKNDKTILQDIIRPLLRCGESKDDYSREGLARSLKTLTYGQVVAQVA